MKKNFFYLHPEVENLFQNNGLCNFESIWNVDAELVDKPNVARGGWSEVGKLNLADASVTEHFYIKRQQNFHCRLIAKPWQRIPVALREWLSISDLAAAGIATLEVVCSARQNDDSDRMVLITRALTGYLDMDSWFDQNDSTEERSATHAAIGKIAAQLHNAGFMHGCLYPKHIYINRKNGEDVHLIDLEKCKRIIFARSGLRDLDTLLRRFQCFENKDREVFLRAYISEAHTDWTLDSLSAALRSSSVRSSRR